MFNAHLQFLEDFFKITLKGIAQDAFEELNNIIKLTYESVGIRHDADCTEFKPEQFPTFDTLKAGIAVEFTDVDYLHIKITHNNQNLRIRNDFVFGSEKRLEIEHNERRSIRSFLP